MTTAETKALVTLLATLCPARQPQITRSFAAAWCAALEPYAYDAARAAALDYARRKPFFPAVSDLVSAIEAQERPEYRNDLANAERLLAQMQEARREPHRD